eukprot:3821812-Amphidinium_carterae.2
MELSEASFNGMKEAGLPLTHESAERTEVVGKSKFEPPYLMRHCYKAETIHLAMGRKKFDENRSTLTTERSRPGSFKPLFPFCQHSCDATLPNQHDAGCDVREE